MLGTFALTSRWQKEEIKKYKQLKKILVFINSSDVFDVNINFDEWKGEKKTILSLADGFYQGKI